MMVSQMKIGACQWHALHRALVCRLYQTGQQSNSQSVQMTNQRENLTQVPIGCHHNTNSSVISFVSSRQYNQCAANNTYKCRVSLESDAGMVPRRCLSTSGASKATTGVKKPPLASRTSRYVITPELASLVVDKIWNGESVSSERVQSLIIDTNPGPGFVTKELLNRGAKKVVAIEKKKNFMRDLTELASQSGGRLTVYNGDYFNLCQRNTTKLKTKLAVSARDIFHGVQPQLWKCTDPKFAVNIVGALPLSREQGHVFYLVCQLFNRASAFHYGRVQHSLFVSERMYRMMSQEPGGRLEHYTNIAAMFQLCCDVKLLHIEPHSSFILNGINAKKPKNLCLVQLTPKLDFFDHELTPDIRYLFIYFLRQMLVHRRKKLKEKIEDWAPGHSDIIFDFNFNEKTKTGDLSGTDFLRVFLAIRKLDTFNEWMGEHFQMSGERSDSRDEDVDHIETEEEEDDIDAAALS